MMDDSELMLNQLMADLGNKDAGKRMHARAALVQLGSAAVPALLNALDAPQQHARWEAAKALAEIADPAAAQGLADALGDEDEDVRWVVAEALIALGREATKPLLSKLAESELPDGLYRGAHHVLHDLARHGDLDPVLAPVLRALEHSEPAVTVPPAAEEALRSGGA
jgi:HEAT repeat protein